MSGSHKPEAQRLLEEKYPPIAMIGLYKLLAGLEEATPAERANMSAAQRASTARLYRELAAVVAPAGRHAESMWDFFTKAAEEFETSIIDSGTLH